MWRFSALFALIALALAVIIARLFYWQILSHGRLSTAASDQYRYQLELPPRRGDILARDQTPLVTNQIAYLVYAEPQKITNTASFVQKVGEILDIQPAELTEKISNDDVSWVVVNRKTPEDVVEKLQALDVPGIGFEKEGKRFYPEASMAAQLIGFVASDKNGQDTGYFGIEDYYNRELQGRGGVLVQEKDARGLPILLGDQRRFEPEDGRTLVLHLDKTVQYIIEKHLQEGIRRFGAKSGSIIVYDPQTGGVLGLATVPSYDPRAFLEYPRQRYINPVVAETYEPGSTFKALVMAAALEEEVVKPDTVFDETGPIQMGEYTIRTWNRQYNGEITMTQVLEHSSNVGMVHVAELLGQDKLISYIQRFGFGQQTGIDLGEETAAPLRDAQDWRTIDLATASFGQGIAVTPIQMVRAVGALANDGKLMEPHLVKEIRDNNGRIIAIKPKVQEQVVSEDTARTITDMLVSTVRQGDAQWAAPKGYRIAGKTGTAQIPIAGHYDPEKTIASFVGYAPADDPRFVMLVTLREPSSSPWGSETAAPLFFDVTRALFGYFGISPE